MAAAEHDAVRCVQLVELLTAYLEAELSDEVRQQVDDHLKDCEGCRNALGQWRAIVEVTGRLSAGDVADLDPYLRQRFTTALATLRRK